MQGKLLNPGVTEGAGFSISLWCVWSLTDLQEQLTPPLMTWHNVITSCLGHHHGSWHGEVQIVGLFCAAQRCSFASYAGSMTHDVDLSKDAQLTDDLWPFAVDKGLNFGEGLNRLDVCDRLVTVCGTAH